MSKENQFKVGQIIVGRNVTGTPETRVVFGFATDPHARCPTLLSMLLSDKNCVDQFIKSKYNNISVGFPGETMLSIMEDNFVGTGVNIWDISPEVSVAKGKYETKASIRDLTNALNEYSKVEESMKLLREKGYSVASKAYGIDLSMIHSMVKDAIDAKQDKSETISTITSISGINKINIGLVISSLWDQFTHKKGL